jgi:hypothetical protein
LGPLFISRPDITKANAGRDAKNLFCAGMAGYFWPNRFILLGSRILAFCAAAKGGRSDGSIPKQQTASKGRMKRGSDENGKRQNESDIP